MGNDQDSVLPVTIRKTFEQYGVVKPAGWPKLDQLIKSIRRLKYSYDISTSNEGTATARVRAAGVTYTSVDGEPERALAKSLDQALREHGKSQLSIFGGDDDPDPDGSIRHYRHTFEANSPNPFVPTTEAVDLDQDGNIIDSYLVSAPDSPTPDPSGPVRKTVRNPDGDEFTYDEHQHAYVSADGEVLDPMVAARLVASVWG